MSVLQRSVTGFKVISKKVLQVVEINFRPRLLHLHRNPGLPALLHGSHAARFLALRVAPWDNEGLNRRLRKSPRRLLYRSCPAASTSPLTRFRWAARALSWPLCLVSELGVGTSILGRNRCCCCCRLECRPCARRESRPLSRRRRRRRSFPPDEKSLFQSCPPTLRPTASQRHDQVQRSLLRRA